MSKKAFNKLLNELNEGSTHAGLTADMSELLKTVQNTGRGGSLTLKIKVAPALRNQTGGVDKITITAERKLELPKPVAPSDFFWLTEDGETSRSHPRQNELELREVGSTNGVTSANLKKAV